MTVIPRVVYKYCTSCSLIISLFHSYNWSIALTISSYPSNVKSLFIKSSSLNYSSVGISSANLMKLISSVSEILSIIIVFSSIYSKLSIEFNKTVLNLRKPSLPYLNKLFSELPIGANEIYISYSKGI